MIAGFVIVASIYLTFVSVGCAPREVRKRIGFRVKDMWLYSPTKSNGITEGFHNKMEMISRRAFGFRNFENYRLRVRVLCG